MRIFARALLVLLFAVTACGDDTPTTPSGPATATIVQELFTGALASGQTDFYSFSVTFNGTVSVMLATTTNDAGAPLARQLRMGLGIPAGTGCAVTTMIGVTAALASQITMTLAPGVYCVNVIDSGATSGSVNFNIRITHP
jgi:hypothetical protein